MLDLINIHKTFNPGTINEKVALDGVNLHLDHHRRQRRRQIHHPERRRRRVAGGRGHHPH